MLQVVQANNNQIITIDGEQYILDIDSAQPILKRYDEQSKMWIILHFNGKDVDDAYITKLLATNSSL